MNARALLELTLAFELIGTAAFALTGVMTAVKKQLDVLGVLVVGVTTAVGGGALRDVLLGRLPPVMFTAPVYAIVAAGVCLVSFLWLYLRGPRSIAFLERLNPVINVFDAIGLGVFAVAGVRAAILTGFADNAFLAVFVGAVTGVGGGLMRDLLVGDIPMVLKKRVYALAAVAGAAAYYGLTRLHADAGAAQFCGIGIVVLIRLLATHYKWNLPRIRTSETSAIDLPSAASDGRQADASGSVLAADPASDSPGANLPSSVPAVNLPSSAPGANSVSDNPAADPASDNPGA